MIFGVILDWLKQPSTIKGLATIATAVIGHQLSPEAINSIIAAGACVYGAVDVIRNENKPIKTIITR